MTRHTIRAGASVLLSLLAACSGGTNTGGDARSDAVSMNETAVEDSSNDTTNIDAVSDVPPDTQNTEPAPDVALDTQDVVAPPDNAPPDTITPDAIEAGDVVADVAMNMCMPGSVTCGMEGVCIDLMSDRANCGRCGNACTGGQFCQMGTCGCGTGRMTCGGMCVDVQSDNTNCGGCGMACGAGQTCMAGRCTCPMGQSVCGTGATSTCVNTTNDTMNCGMCGTRCATGQTCSMGTCSCGMGQTLCGTGMAAACTNTQSDTNNCGACGTACAMGQSCVMGMCQCPMGQTACGTGASTTCVDTQADRANCGMCGNACPAGQFCNAGTCRVDCTAPQVPCGSGTMMSCANTQSDENNCGMCGNRCAAGQSCMAGRCVCPMGQTACMNGMTTTCVNTASDTANCGACGRSCSGGPNVTAGVCSDGMCSLICAPGFANCDGNPANGCEARLATDTMNCGSCGNACTATNACFAGMCAATSCRTLLAANPSLPSGLYPIDPDGAGPLPPVTTHCDMTTRGGGWTLVQRSVLDYGMTQMLQTTRDVFRNNTIGNPAPGNFFRVAASYWPGLQSTREHMIVHTAARQNNTACSPLRYIAPAGTWNVPATGNITLTNVTEPGGGVNFFHGQGGAGITTTDVNNGTGPSCVNQHQAAPWFYVYCCATCFSFGQNYWGYPANPPRPMASYLGVPDINGQTITQACAGDPSPVQTSGGYYGEMSMEYYLR